MFYWVMFEIQEKDLQLKYFIYNFFKNPILILRYLLSSVRQLFLDYVNDDWYCSVKAGLSADSSVFP